MTLAYDAGKLPKSCQICGKPAPNVLGWGRTRPAARPRNLWVCSPECARDSMREPTPMPDHIRNRTIRSPDILEGA